MPKSKLLKCLLVGDKAAGKTALIEKFCSKRLPKKLYEPTQHLQFYCKTIKFDPLNKQVVFQIYDSQEYIPEDSWRHLRDVEVSIICINITSDEEMFNQAIKNIDRHIRLLSQNTLSHIFLIATGCIKEPSISRMELLENIAKDKEILFYGAVDASIPDIEMPLSPTTAFFRLIAQLPAISWSPEAKIHARTQQLFRTTTIAVLSLSALTAKPNQLQRLPFELICEVLETAWNTIINFEHWSDIPDDLGVKSIDNGI